MKAILPLVAIGAGAAALYFVSQNTGKSQPNLGDPNKLPDPGPPPPEVAPISHHQHRGVDYSVWIYSLVEGNAWAWRIPWTYSYSDYGFARNQEEAIGAAEDTIDLRLDRDGWKPGEQV